MRRCRKASTALADYRQWLQANLPYMSRDFAVGEKGYTFYLHEVALLPYTPEQILGMARQDLLRVIAIQALERQRDINAPQLKSALTSDEEIARMAHADAEIRQYLCRAPNPQRAGRSASLDNACRPRLRRYLSWLRRDG
jgi:hypothetical protein